MFFPKHFLLSFYPSTPNPSLTIGGCWHTLIWQRWMVKMACERELWAFIWVLAVVRDRAPSFRHCSSCSTHTHATHRYTEDIWLLSKKINVDSVTRTRINKEYVSTYFIMVGNHSFCWRQTFFKHFFELFYISTLKTLLLSLLMSPLLLFTLNLTPCLFTDSITTLLFPSSTCYDIFFLPSRRSAHLSLIVSQLKILGNLKHGWPLPNSAIHLFPFCFHLTVNSHLSFCSVTYLEKYPELYRVFSQTAFTVALPLNHHLPPLWTSLSPAHHVSTSRHCSCPFYILITSSVFHTVTADPFPFLTIIIDSAWHVATSVLHQI